MPSRQRPRRKFGTWDERTSRNCSFPTAPFKTLLVNGSTVVKISTGLAQATPRAELTTELANKTQSENPGLEWWPPWMAA